MEVLFLGLPETGKTTFLVALDEVLERQSDEHGLISGGFAANRSYIDSAKSTWRAGVDISRTNLQPTSEPVELLVRCGERSARLVSPDVHGEFFDDQWADRSWPVPYRERLASVAGVLLFVNAAHHGRNSEMTNLWQNVPGVTSAPKPWEARLAAPQIKLVDLLQCITERGEARKPMPLTVMISAWDLVESRDAPSHDPTIFLANEWSLLHQYLKANADLFAFRVYGVSARGGPDAVQANLVRSAPHERVWLKDGATVTGDLTLPIRWLLGWE